MDLTKFSTGNYLKAEDIRVIANTWTILSSEERQMPDGDKAILTVETHTPKDGYVKKDFTLNMTNVNRLADCFGTYIAEQMVGKKLVLTVDRVSFKGKEVDGVRVDVKQTINVNKLQAPTPPTNIGG